MNGSIDVIQAVDQIVQAITSQNNLQVSVETILSDVTADPGTLEAKSVTLANELGIGIPSAQKILTDAMESVNNNNSSIYEAADQILKTTTYVDVSSLISIVTSLFDNSSTIDQVVNDMAELLDSTLYGLTDILVRLANGSIDVIQTVDEIVQAILSQNTLLANVENIINNLDSNYDPEELEASSMPGANYSFQCNQYCGKYNRKYREW